MSDRELDVNLSSTTAKTIDDQLEAVPNVIETQKKRITLEEARARVARVLSRDMLVDRLKVDLPPDMHGEWVSRDSSSIARMELLGYEIDTQYAVNRKLNDSGDGSAIIGDVVFMTCPVEIKIAQEEFRKKQYEETHLRNPRRQPEEREFEALNKSQGLNTVVESQTDVVDGVTIERTLTGR